MTRRRSLVLFVFAWLVAAPLAAQTTVTIAVFASTVTDPSTATPVATAVTYPMSGVACGLAKTTTPANVVNPTTAAFDDPADSTKDCQVTITTQVAALANGSYKAAARYDSDPTWSNLSNPFDRRRVVNFRVR